MTSESEVATGRAGERTDGLRSVLSFAPMYRAAQHAIGAVRFRDTVAAEFIRASADDRVLDIGCGTADILDHLPAVDYIGFDPSENYVADAQQRFGDRGRFVASTGGAFEAGGGDRTIVMAIGVLHHLDDDEAAAVVDLAHRALAPGGRLVTVDPTLVAGQHPVARFLVSRDRGQNVRSPEATQELILASFDAVEITVRHDLLRTPYSHVIAEAAA